MDISPLLLSLKTACLATVITFFAGLWIAYKVIKIKHGKAVLDTILTLPMILPPTVVGFFLLLFLEKADRWERGFPNMECRLYFHLQVR